MGFYGLLNSIEQDIKEFIDNPDATNFERFLTHIEELELGRGYNCPLCPMSLRNKCYFLFMGRKIFSDDPVLNRRPLHPIHIINAIKERGITPEMLAQAYLAFLEYSSTREAIKENHQNN